MDKSKFVFYKYI